MQPGTEAAKGRLMAPNSLTRKRSEFQILQRPQAETGGRGHFSVAHLHTVLLPHPGSTDGEDANGTAPLLPFGYIFLVPLSRYDTRG